MTAPSGVRGRARSRTRGLACLVAATLVLAGCGGEPDSTTVTTPATTATTTIATTPPTSPPTIPDPVVETPTPAETSPDVEEVGDALGCGEYCLQAGEYGAPDDELDDPADLSDPDLILVDGVLPVTVDCLIDVTCRGAILIWVDIDDEYTELGRSDLEVDGDSTRTIAVEVTAEGLGLLDEEQTLRDVVVTLDLGNPCPDGDVHCIVHEDATVDAS
ncbi:hypothetical protein [Actinoplanes sp. NBRC 101535]|uniref:hypothetical protein n=1 Tax=Actinoplanes sp. NBRC 101535 TaxID=3032196 RepID=UPI0024A071AC|nr:hypothetical protein [Actinoplanes sp. NBRC 101535]GLY03917.1 hypothetical protein Acsp01_42960 [Actinoplanes sp. NBRC 101535]